MFSLRELLRLKFAQKLPHRAISRSLGISTSTVSALTRKAVQQGLTWPLPEAIDDAALEKVIYGASSVPPPPPRKTEPSYVQLKHELQRKGVTLQLLWQEYRDATPTDEQYSYSQFCQRYRDWRKRQPLSMRQTHHPADKLFIDYAGLTLPITDPATGECHGAQLFVAVLGYSSYTFAEVTRTQTLPDWIASHHRALQFFGGVPKLIVPDNLKSAISKACRYEPDDNPTYAYFAQHYGVAILPARPYKPKDKAKAENAVLVAERWILARLRHHTFFSLSEANAAIRELLNELNNRRMRSYGESRRERFERHECTLLSPLPNDAYSYTEIKRVRVHIDYHVEIDKHYYSVPYAYIKQELQAFCSAERITIKKGNRVIASHARSSVMGAHSTDKTHMPKHHLAHSDWSPERLQNWATQIGPACLQLVTQWLHGKAHPEQAYRACLGLLSLAKAYRESRLENACARALHLRSTQLKTVRNILQNGLDQQALTPLESATLPAHDNIRGAHHYH